MADDEEIITEAALLSEPHYATVEGITHRVVYQNATYALTSCNKGVWVKKMARVDGPMTCFACINEVR